MKGVARLQLQCGSLEMIIIFLRLSFALYHVGRCVLNGKVRSRSSNRFLCIAP